MFYSQHRILFKYYLNFYLKHGSGGIMLGRLFSAAGTWKLVRNIEDNEREPVKG